MFTRGTAVPHFNAAGPHGAGVNVAPCLGSKNGRQVSTSDYEQYDYDGFNRMATIRENGATSGAGVLVRIGYDSVGRRSQLTRGNGVVANYRYDPLTRLANLEHNSAGSLVRRYGHGPGVDEAKF